jgi:ribonucleotide reductase alpha subunit
MSIAHLTSDALRVFKARYLRRNPDETIAESQDDLFFREAQMGGDPEEGCR